MIDYRSQISEVKLRDDKNGLNRLRVTLLTLKTEYDKFFNEFLDENSSKSTRHLNNVAIYKSKYDEYIELADCINIINFYLEK